jgi:hypothetical protein
VVVAGCNLPNCPLITVEAVIAEVRSLSAHA